MPTRARTSRGGTPVRVRTRMAATVSASDIVRTSSEIDRVWLPATDLFPAHAVEALSYKEAGYLVSMFERNQILAYRCVRWARWMTEQRCLTVTCPACLGKAWSYGVVTHRIGKKQYRVDDGKWRWICQDRGRLPRRRVAPPHPQRRKTDTCGREFCDTTSTPFFNSQLPPGLVLAALSYPGSTIQRLLERLDRHQDSHDLQTILEHLRETRQPPRLDRLKQYATLFCGSVLLAHCPTLTRPFDGYAKVNRRLTKELTRPEILAEVQAGFTQSARKKYQRATAALRRLMALDLSLSQGNPADRHLRHGLFSEVQEAVSQLTAPKSPPPITLQKVLALLPPLAQPRIRR